MEWTNESVLQFIELLQGEQIIWNPKHGNHKNRNLVNDAWIRIKNDFSLSLTIEELKKKKNTLYTQYRDYLRKIKDSTKSGSRTNEIYQPSWFAFDALNSFLSDKYDYQPALKNEGSDIEVKFSFEPNTQNESNSSQSTRSTYRPLKRRSVSSTDESLPSTSGVGERNREVRIVEAVNRPVDEPLTLIKEISFQRENDNIVNECDLYGQLLAHKLKKMDEDDRLRLMNDIDNLTFKHIMSGKARNRP